MISSDEILKFLKDKHNLISSIFSFETNTYSALMEPHWQFFENWLNNNFHAEMNFLQNNFEARKNPSLILKNVKSAIVFLFPYSHGLRVRGTQKKQLFNFVEKNSLIEKKLISKYVYGKDYHRVIKNKLNKIATELKEEFNIRFEFRPVVDSVPFFDRAHARESGIGFIGKNTLLIRPGLGSFFFVATLLTDISIEINEESLRKKNLIKDLDCGDCKKCLEACPTQALVQPYTLDSNKCLSYLTIEHRNRVDAKYIPFFAETIYGCDVCQDVCPYNLVTSDFVILPEFINLNKSFSKITVKELAFMDQKQYEQWFGGSAATRAKIQGVIRNALYHLYATRDPDLNEVLNHLEKSPYPLVVSTVQQIKTLPL